MARSRNGPNEPADEPIDLGAEGDRPAEPGPTGEETASLAAADPKLESVRAILLAREQARIAALEERAAAMRLEGQAREEELQAQIDALHQEVARLSEQLDSESLFPRLIHNLSTLVSGAVQSSRRSMAEALSPVMGEAISAQIRDSQDEMVEALYPVILRTVQRAISEFARELQRNIDNRMRSTFAPSGALRSLVARVRGVPHSQLVLRDSLPFSVSQLFLIQQESGLLMAHYSSKGEADQDSDLISGMLTAIRDFSQDSFGQGDESEELDEIQYGDQRIITKSGPAAYLAAVIRGVEPEGYRARMADFLAGLHDQYGRQLRDYSGDPAVLPDVNKWLASLASAYVGQDEREAQPKPMGRNQRLALIGAGLAGVVALACACFYLQFTVALLPLAFGETATATTTPTHTALPTATPTNTALPTATPTNTPLPTATATNTPQPTATDTPQPTPTDTSTITATPTEVAAQAWTIAPVWARVAPDVDGGLLAAVPQETMLTIVSQFGQWVEVEWQATTGTERGWVQLRWLSLNHTIPDEVITPSA